MPGFSVKCCSNWNGNTKNTNIQYFRFPKDEEIVNKWIEAWKNDKLNLAAGKVFFFFLNKMTHLKFIKQDM